MIRQGGLSETFHVKSTSYHPFSVPLLLMVLEDCIDNKGTGIQWIIGKSLEYLEHADDLVLLSHTFNHVPEKT